MEKTKLLELKEEMKIWSKIFPLSFRELFSKMILPEDFFSPKSDSKKKKIFFKKSGERKIHPDFGKGQKFNHFIFSSPEFGWKSFPAGKDFMGLSFHFQFGESFEF